MTSRGGGFLFEKNILALIFVKKNILASTQTKKNRLTLGMRKKLLPSWGTKKISCPDDEKKYGPPKIKQTIRYLIEQNVKLTDLLSNILVQCIQQHNTYKYVFYWTMNMMKQCERTPTSLSPYTGLDLYTGPRWTPS